MINASENRATKVMFAPRAGRYPYTLYSMGHVSNVQFAFGPKGTIYDRWVSWLSFLRSSILAGACLCARHRSTRVVVVVDNLGCRCGFELRSE